MITRIYTPDELTSEEKWSKIQVGVIPFVSRKFRSGPVWTESAQEFRVTTQE